MKVLFAGRKSVSADLLTALSAMEQVEVVGVLTDNHLAVSPTSRVAEALSVPILDFKQTLEKADSGELEFDLVLSVLYWRRMRGGLLSNARLGAINFHPAPLPEYKGTAGYNLAILDGLSEWGVTAHYMDEHIDTGEIIEVDRFVIDQEAETVRSLELVCMKRIHEQFLRVVGATVATDARLPTSANKGGRYVSRVEMEAMKEIQPGDDVARKIRAFWYPPYDGAFVTINGERYSLVDRTLLQQLADPNSSSLFSSVAKESVKT
ncbi:formyltransferase family protein [Rhizobium wuzhouense]|uniref:Formyl transferase n=1 Tax=Rhizobium wuzhouense TaxID=1986026 RepID=A0ABX5NV96_9HYPH|nr:formyltransferase family protein [Rhizobium wuzhouense]PYB77093.1 formyl transferase [Rhizobium wuzhouense]